MLLHKMALVLVFFSQLYYILFVVCIADNGSVERNENDSIVNVPQIFDEEFSTFFGNVDSLIIADNVAELSSDFSDIKIEGPRLL